MKKNIILLLAISSLGFIACGDKSKADNTAKVSGKDIFGKHCVLCHGTDGKLGLNGSKDLTISTLSHADRISIITKGKGLMTPYGAILSKEEIAAVAKYTESLK